MGLDFYIEKKRKGEAYEGSNWEEVAYGRNCYAVRDAVLCYVDTDKDDYVYPVGFGTLNNIVKALIDEAVSQRDFNNKEEMTDDDGYIKMMYFASDLAKDLAVSAADYEYETAEYEYRIINSY